MKIKKIVRRLAFGICLILISGIGFAQEETNVTEDDEGLLPVRSPWTASVLIDNQTTEAPGAKSFEFNIHHRFGKIFEISDLFGIYAASNIRMGLNYGITDKISIGFGSEKDHKMQEFQGKYKIISQSRNGKIPVSVTYFGNVVIDARDEEFFGTKYEFLNRLSFFNQIIVSRKFTNALSMQVAGSFSHYNAVTDLSTGSKGESIGKWKNDYVGAMIGLRYKIHNNISAIGEYHHPFAINEPWQGQTVPYPNFGVGVEMGTSTHAFQVFAANYGGIIAQENYSHNINDMTYEGWRVGFNITVRF